jgi:hypothetical protein
LIDSTYANQLLPPTGTDCGRAETSEDQKRTGQSQKLPVQGQSVVLGSSQIISFSRMLLVRVVLMEHLKYLSAVDLLRCFDVWLSKSVHFVFLVPRASLHRPLELNCSINTNIFAFGSFAHWSLLPTQGIVLFINIEKLDTLEGF